MPSLSPSLPTKSPAVSSHIPAAATGICAGEWTTTTHQSGRRGPLHLRRAAPLLILLLTVACGSHAASSQIGDGGAELEECRAYLNVLGTCMRRLSPQTTRIAEARVENARLALEHVKDREQLRRTCVGGATQLQVSCQ